MQQRPFMMYLPRLCEHCLNPACVASCPSGSIYKREEDGIVLIDQDKCRGWRMCVFGCPDKAGLSGRGRTAPTEAETALALEVMVETVCQGSFGRYAAYDAHGEPLGFS